MCFSRFIPRKLAEFSTRFNKHIRVNDFSGEKMLLVSGSPQSGPYIRTIWKKALDAFDITPALSTNSILMLGVGGGTCISLLHEMYSKASIVGVERDPDIIDIAKQYFQLPSDTYFQIECSDAYMWVKQGVRLKKIYDLIVVDIFTGRHIPSFISNRDFLIHLKKLLSSHGILIINYLREKEYNKRSEILNKKLHTLFQNVSEFTIFRNRIFCIKPLC